MRWLPLEVLVVLVGASCEPSTRAVHPGEPGEGTRVAAEPGAPARTEAEPGSGTDLRSEPEAVTNASRPAVTIHEATLHYQERRLGDARAAALEILAESPGEARAMNLLAHINLEEGNVGEALAIANTCVSTDPELADCWLVVAVVQQSKKEVGAAVDAWSMYLELAPNGPYATMGRRELARLRGH